MCRKEPIIQVSQHWKGKPSISCSLSYTVTTVNTVRAIYGQTHPRSGQRLGLLSSYILMEHPSIHHLYCSSSDCSNRLCRQSGDTSYEGRLQYFSFIVLFRLNVAFHHSAIYLSVQIKWIYLSCVSCVLVQWVHSICAWGQAVSACLSSFEWRWTVMATINTLSYVIFHLKGTIRLKWSIHMSWVIHYSFPALIFFYVSVTCCYTSLTCLRCCISLQSINKVLSYLMCR